MTESHAQLFREEAFELLVELEASLLELEENPRDKETVGRVFRSLHTIKGSGSMFGFDELAGFVHELETAFDLVRSDRMDVTKPLVDLTLSATDEIRAILEGEPLSDAGREILRAVGELVPEGPECRGPDREDTPRSPGPIEGEVTYRIHFQPHPDLFLKGTNPVLLLDELRELGECRVVAHTEAIALLEDLDPEQCQLSWDILLTTSCGINAVQDVFIFVVDDCELKIEAIDELSVSGDAESYKKLGEILVERGFISKDDLDKVLGTQKRIGEMLLDSGLIDTDKIESALAEQRHVNETRKKRQQEEMSASIKVPAERLDTLVDLVGELVTVQARLSQISATNGDPQLVFIAEDVERLVAELRDNTMSIRMLPIGTTFNKFKRLVRDLSSELGKKVALITEGGETELDKTVIERLNDPLVHLIRNCIDHGIETSDIRRARGKGEEGTVRLSAVHSGANVLIRITDDGAGLDPEAIRAKAVEKGLMAPDKELPEKEAFGMIFAPGFSTAKQISNISGRGVGLDVVKRSIDSLRGSIDLDSRKGMGATFTIKLPLTLAIIDGLLVQVGGAYYVLPLSVIEECVELTRRDVAGAHGQNLIHVRGEIVPYVRLRDEFAINGGEPEIEQVVVTEGLNGRIGIAVDKVIGEHQTVIKSLGKMYRQVNGISGATILGDGTVALIVDVPKLVKSVEVREHGGVCLHGG